MTEKDWEKFCDLLDKIVSMEGVWQDKAKVVKEKIEQYGSLENLLEFVTWTDDFELVD
jgi:hypothetical protein